jgi:hypothetical protein
MSHAYANKETERTVGTKIEKMKSLFELKMNKIFCGIVNKGQFNKHFIGVTYTCSKISCAISGQCYTTFYGRKLQLFIIG